MYYIIETNYVGSDFNENQYAEANHIDITTTPPTHNSSGEKCLGGWCGTTNGFAVNAHGKYKTIEGARAEVKERFGERREVNGPEGVVVRFIGKPSAEWYRGN